MIQSLTAIDDFIAYQAGTHIVKLTWTNRGVFTVAVNDGVHRLDELGGAFPTEAEARLVARGYAQMFNAEHEARTARPATLDAYRQPSRPVRNTRTRAYLKPPTAAMLRLMRAHTNGIVTTDGRANWTTLRAIVDKGLADIHTVCGAHVIESVRLNARGMAAIAQSKEIAA